MQTSNIEILWKKNSKEKENIEQCKIWLAYNWKCKRKIKATEIEESHKRCLTSDHEWKKKSRLSEIIKKCQNHISHKNIHRCELWNYKQDHQENCSNDDKQFQETS